MISVANANASDPVRDYECRGTISLHWMVYCIPYSSLEYTGAAQSIIHKSVLPGIEKKYIGEKAVEDLT